MKRIASCSCNQLSITTEGNPIKISVCHCKACQRRTGSAFGVAVFFDAEKTVISGHGCSYRRLGDSGKSLTFHFCPACGSTVYWMPDFKPGVTAIALGCFDKAETLLPSQCVNEDQQYAWVELHLPSA